MRIVGTRIAFEELVSFVPNFLPMIKLNFKHRVA